MDKVLIDTDVILDFFFDRQPFADYSAQVIGLCELNNIRGFVTPVIFSNIYYLLRQTARHDKVIDNLKPGLGNRFRNEAINRNKPGSLALIA
jgi:predicted nucleic acid-binding protein